MRVNLQFVPRPKRDDETIEQWGREVLPQLLDFLRSLREAVNANDGAAMIASASPSPTLREVGRLYLVLGAGAGGSDELRFVVNDGAGGLKIARVTGVTLI